MSKSISLFQRSHFQLLSIPLALSILLIGSKNIKAASDQEIKAQADSRRLYMRITGMIPSHDIHQQMYQDFLNGRADLAALRALSSADQGFYKNTVKAIFNPILTIERDPSLDLNEATATIAGLILNNEDFRQVVDGDVLYTAQDSLVDWYTNIDDDDDDQTPDVTYDVNVIGGVRNPLYSRYRTKTGNDAKYADGSDVPDNLWVVPLLNSSNFDALGDGFPMWEYRSANETNLQYRQLEQRIESWPSKLQRHTQSEVYKQLGEDASSKYRIAPQDVAGIMTLPTMGQAAFQAGTNRRIFRMAMYGFMCKELDEVKDASAPDFRVRRDVTRDSNYQTCRSCHGQMDGAVGAFVYFHHNGQTLQYYPSELVNNPINQNDIQGLNTGTNRKIRRQFDAFESGHNPVNNSFYNFMTGGPNSALGFRDLPSGKSLTQGTGARHLSEVWANTEQFSTCMAERVYQRICLHSLETETDSAKKNAIIQKLAEIGKKFESGVSDYSQWGANQPYNFKTLVAQVSAACFE